MVRAIGFDDEGIARARTVGAEKFRRAPIGISYEVEYDTLTITMPNQVRVIIPRKWIGTLRTVPKAMMKSLRLGADHRSFDIDAYDIHISAFGLLRLAVLGEDPYARAGSSTSRAKVRAARRNGAKGGRPKKRVQR